MSIRSFSSPLLALLLGLSGAAQAASHTLTLLSPSESTSSIANAINDHGTVSGSAMFSAGDTTPNAYLWSNGMFQDMEVLRGGYSQGIDVD